MQQLSGFRWQAGLGVAGKDRALVRPLSMFALLAFALLNPFPSGAQGVEEYDQAPVSYSTTHAKDAVTRLQARMASGELKWTGGGKEIVRRLLLELGIPVESQLLVFSKTSFQREAIGPHRPRALYFSDSCYVGWVPGGLIEICAIDPQLGPVFYSFDPNAARPDFVRDGNCMTCHGGMFVRGIPGVFTRSVYTDTTGEPLFRFGSEVVDFRTPFTNRWAGWYVTGRHGKSLHRGNVTAQDKDDRLVVDLKRGANTLHLSKFFSTESYLAEGSDIVALLVFEHQTAVQNSLTRAGMDCRRMLAYQKNLQLELKEPVTVEPAYESVRHVFDGAAQDVVDNLLSRNEAPLPAGLAGDKSFQKAFCERGPRSEDGGSLKDFQLAGRLFKNRCSHLIYSDCFRTLPPELKRLIVVRLSRALSPTAPDPRYAYLPPEERSRIAKILRQTHPEFRQGLWPTTKSAL